MSFGRHDSLSERIIQNIRNIPKGKVATYGQIADMAGNPRASRLVVRALNSSKAENLPWHRVVNSHGSISLKRGFGYEVQKSLLEAEGVVFDDTDKIDLRQFQWQADPPPNRGGVNVSHPS